jgi:hypothetical protein
MVELVRKSMNQRVISEPVIGSSSSIIRILVVRKVYCYVQKKREILLISARFWEALALLTPVVGKDLPDTGIRTPG